ncbi:hypothetical protein RND81_13G114700 [Saponaria officinalis]|uniref:Calmodulin-binding domain-containing protein n=1 Tax=Saponaria officinalis TaxID=3572 RepID=A0AAW1GZD3_SAPOF
MTDENSDKTNTSDRTDPEIDHTIINSGLPVKEAIVENIEQRKKEFDIEEEIRDLSKNCRVPDDVIEQQTSPVQRTDISGQFNRNTTAVIVGSDHKFTVRSRYRHASVGSCHDLCKLGHKHEREKVQKRSFLGTIREGQPLIRAASADKAQFRCISLSGPLLGKDILNNTEGKNSPKRINSTQSKMKRVQSESKPSSVPTHGNSVCRSKTEVSAAKKNLPVKSSQKVEEKVKATVYKNLFFRSMRQSNSEDPNINKSRDVTQKAVYMIESNVNDTEKGEELPSTSRESRLGKTKRSRKIEDGEYETIVNQQIKAKRTSGTIRSEGKDSCSVWRLNFGKGRVVNLQGASNSSKNLRFKKGRILGESRNAKAETRLKNADEMTDKLPVTEPEKVHLRRQEASGKKGSIDLNNVIEETASKLVKTRKSKVKALVGAFETVMSFRHREPFV